MPKPPRTPPITEPSNLTFDFVSHVPTRPSGTSASTTAPTTPRMPDTARESHTPWQVDSTQSSSTPPTPALPQGYKQTDVGIIPEDWEVVTVYDMAQVGTGSKNTQDRTSEGKYPFFVRSFTIERINTFSYDGEAVLTAGDGVGTGKVVHYINGRFDVHQRVYQISDFHANIKGYYFYLYFSMFFYARIMKMTAKSSVDSVRLEMITQMPIPLPPMEEQEAIAEALSDADALVDALERLLWKKRRIKEGAMQELLTGRTRLPGFNGAWETKRLGEVFDVSGGLSASRAQLGDEGYCYLHYGDIHSSSRAFISVFEEFSVLPKLPIGLKNVPLSAMLKDGDVVFVDASEDEEGASKHIVVVNPRGQPFISGLHTIVAKSKTAHLCNLYKRYCFQTSKVKEQFRFYSVGTKVLGVNKSNIVKISILVPPLEEQEAIAEVLCGMDEEIEALEEKLAKARMVKQGMMQELLTGRIRLQ